MYTCAVSPQKGRGDMSAIVRRLLVHRFAAVFASKSPMATGSSLVGGGVPLEKIASLGAQPGKDAMMVHSHWNRKKNH